MRAEIQKFNEIIPLRRIIVMSNMAFREGIPVMAYSQETLGQNEKLIYVAKFHILYYVAAWVSTGVLLLMAIASLIFIAGATRWLSIGICAAGIAVVLREMLPIWTTEIAVTNQRLIVKRGWLARSTTELQLKAIEQVNFHQGLLGQLLNFGKIVIHGTGVDDIELPNIARPTELVKAIENAFIPVKQAPLVIPDEPGA